MIRMAIGWWIGLAVAMIFNFSLMVAFLFALIGMGLGAIWDGRKYK